MRDAVKGFLLGVLLIRSPAVINVPVRGSLVSPGVLLGVLDC